MGLQRVRLFVAVGLTFLAVAAAAQSNPITIENQQAGTTAWQIPFGSAGSDGVGQMKGYASAVSVNKGDSITFYVSVNPAQSYTIDVYRLGWYQGQGGRLLQHVGPLSGTQQPTCPTDATTGMIECHWAPAYTLATQTSWTSGIYFAKLTNSQGFQNYIVFCVRDDGRVAPLLFHQNVTTYQAYNDYPYDNSTGKSLYAFDSHGANTISGGPQAVKVSFDRPYEYDGSGNVYSNTFLAWEYPFVRWMEKSGYDVTYSTDVDTHINPSMLLKYNGILSVGHDEYFSKPMYDGFFAARDAGVNLAFFGANPIGWQIRFEPSSSGVANRVIVCYRNANLDPVTDPTLKTVQWRDPPVNRAEQQLVGVQYTVMVPWIQATNAWQDYIVSNSGHWVYAGTGFKDGDKVPSIVGYEADQLFNQYPVPNAVSGTYILLSRSPLNTNNLVGNSSVYQAQSGAWVFAAGSNAWSYGLDNYNSVPSLVDSRIQQTTSNILNQFINPPNNFSIVGATSSQIVTQGGSTSYGVNITPSGSFNGSVTLSVNGLPGGATASFAPNPATTTSTLSVTTSASTPAGTYPLTITGISGTLTHTATVTLVVTPLPDFSLSASPSSQAINPGGATSYGIAINSLSGFNGPVTLSGSGQPSGVTLGFALNPGTSSSPSTLSVTTSASTPAGTYTLTVTGTSGTLTHSVTVTLVVNLPDFSLSASPASQTVNPGGTASYSIPINSMNGFNGPVTLSGSGQPSGVTLSFAPNPGTSSSTLTVNTSGTTPVGSYTLTITGVSGSLTHTTTVSLAVAIPDFVMAASPASATLQVGGSTNYTITIAPIAGFAGSVTFAVSGLPTGANGTFTPNPATSSSTLSVTTPTSTPAGTYTLTITGSSGALSHTVGVSLTLNPSGVKFDKAVSSDFQWGGNSITTPPIIISGGANRAAMIMVSMVANNATGITATLGGVTGTLIPGTDTGNATSGRTMIFCVTNPPPGSQSATVSWTTSMGADVGVIAVTGANQSTSCTNGTFAATNSSPSRTTSVTITSSPGDLTATLAFTQNVWVTPFTNQTLKFGPDSSAVGGDIGPGTGTTTHSWTDQFSGEWHAVSGANFKAF
jgi:uncharacterized membrane protein